MAIQVVKYAVCFFSIFTVECVCQFGLLTAYISYLT